MTDINTRYQDDPATVAYFAEKRARNAAVLRNAMKAAAGKATDARVMTACMTLAGCGDDEFLDGVVRSLRT